MLEPVRKTAVRSLTWHTGLNPVYFEDGRLMWRCSTGAARQIGSLEMLWPQPPAGGWGMALRPLALRFELPSRPLGIKNGHPWLHWKAANALRFPSSGFRHRVTVVGMTAGLR